jgi:transposase
VLEYKAKCNQSQKQAINEAIRTTQFVRNKAIRYWMDSPKEAKINRIALNNYSTALRKEFSFVEALNSMACQSATGRAWQAIQRFYDNCKKKVAGKTCTEPVLGLSWACPERSRRAVSKGGVEVRDIPSFKKITVQCDS